MIVVYENCSESYEVTLHFIEDAKNKLFCCGEKYCIARVFDY